MSEDRQRGPRDPGAADSESPGGQAERWTSHSEETTRQVGRDLGRRLRPDGVALLYGSLGSGKTVLTRGIARALGLDPGEIQSPTFTLMREHHVESAGEGSGSGGRLIHLDLYRLEPEDTLELGLEEAFASPGVKVVEWADRLPLEIPGALRVAVRRLSDGGREIRLLREGEKAPGDARTGEG